jgi:hypothetical protein
VAWPGRASARRLVVPALVAAACILFDRVLPGRSGALTAGGFAGSLAILIAELARRSRREPSAAPAAVRTESTSIRRAARAAAGPASLLLAALALNSSRAAPAGDDAPIVALFPYEGTFDPARPPDRAILRLEDFRRLTRAAADLDPPRSSVTAISAAHRVARRSEWEILVETEIELAARGPGPFAWRVPVSSARDISATLGGEPVPIAVEPGGGRAAVALPKAGNYLLRVRRWAAARADDAGAQVLNLPVNPAPMAVLVVEPPGDGIPQGTAVTRGRIERRPDQSLAGRLGPSDRIVVRWTPAGRAAAGRERGPVDGLILWDVTPAGDRLRARLTYHRNEEIAAVRLAHDAGLLLRSVQAESPSRVYWEDDAEGGQWLLSFDPPLPPAGSVSVECWRSAPDPPAAGAPGRGDKPAAVVRGFPGIRPAAVERFTGLLGVRRPGDWTGRLVPIRDTEPVDDEAFVKAWGRLPEEPLTLCGTSRFDREPTAALRTGPAPPRVIIRPTAEVRIESGRIVLAVDAEVHEISGHSPIMEAELPEGMELTGVSGDGLIDWTVSADRRLHLIWRRRESGRPRLIHLVGWIPLGDDPLKIGARPHRVRTPWVGWPGADVVRGSLTVACRTKLALHGAAGLSPVPAAASTEPAGGVARVGAASASSAQPLAPEGSLLSYQVNDQDRLGELTWESPPPRVAVVVESQLTIHADFAQWVAVIRYDVIGGGLDRIDLRIPVAWARRARLQAAGDEPPPEPRIDAASGSAFFLIGPKRPLWGSHRLVLSSTLPLGSGREVVYPELSPLGRGEVDAYLGIVNATGRPLAAEDATGLQPVLYAFRFRDREFVRDAGTPAGAFRVVKKEWALRVQLPPGGTEPPGNRDDAARVSLADVALSVMPDRSILGRGLYDIVPDSGRLLTVELPPSSSILWAAVEPNATAPLRAGPSAWSIVVDSGRPERVCLIWKTPPADASARGSAGWSLPLPRAGPGAVRTLLSVSAAAGVRLEGIPSGFERVAMASLDKARADWLGQSLRDSLAKLDRSSGRDHERLVALLINHDLALRAADRAAHRAGALAQGSVGQSEFLDSIAKARSGVAEAVSSAGLTDDLNSARGYLGLARDAGKRPPGGIPEPIAPCRIRAFGRPTAMIGVHRGLDEPSADVSLAIGDGVGDRYPEGESARPIILSALLAIAAVLVIALGGRRAPLAAAASLALTLAVTALAGGPAMLAGALGMAMVARVGWAIELYHISRSH